MKMKTRKNEGKPDLLIRSATIETRAAEGDRPQQVRMSVSSEEPVLTASYFNERWQRVYEILDHSAGSVDMSRCKDGLVVLDRHYGDQVGLMKVELSGGKMGGEVEFCSGSRAQDIAKDAAKGLRRNVSVGYQVRADSYRLEGDKDGIPVVRAMSWTPYEASFEPVPADTTVGVNRADQTTKAAQGTTVEEKKGRVSMDPKEMAKLYERAAKFGIPADKVSDLMTDPTSARAKLDALIVDKQGEDLASERKALVEMKNRKPEAPVGVAPLQPIGGDAKVEQKILRKYSLVNVARALAGQRVDIGFEREISEEIRKNGGCSGKGSISVPHAVLLGRATTLTESGTSSYTVGTELRADMFIDALRPYMILPALGVQFVTGLRGNVAIPKMTATGSGYWVAEEADITRLAPTLGQVALSPHTVGAACDISHLLMQQSTPAADEIVRGDILKSIASKIQQAVFATGGAGAPTPITSATGMNNPTVTGGTPTYAEMLGFPGDILADSATADNQKWAISGAVWKKLAATFTDGTAKAQVLLDWASKTLLGFPYLVSQDVGTNAAFFGDWSTVMIGVWGNGIEINADTSTLSLSGGVRLVGLQDVDVAVRHGAALAYNTSVSA
jgi:HK97 family phage major capsid protein